MQSAESEQALIQQFKGQLALSNIEILDLNRFNEFWDMVFFQKRMTFTTQTMIQQFISPANHDRFYKFAEQKFKKLFHKPPQEGNIKLQENIMDDGRQQGADNSMKKMKKQVNLSYDPSNCPKNILILIISPNQIKKTVLMCSGQDVDIEFQTLNYQDTGIYGRCILVPLNFKLLSISSYSIQIDIKTAFDWILKSQTNVYELEQKVQYHLGKGIVKINDVSGNIDNFLKKFLLKIAQFLFKIESPKGQWKQLKPWWYLLKSIYPEDKLKPESDFIDSLKLDTKDVQFIKYFLWLLKAIYGSELEKIKDNCQCFKQIKFSENYEFPIGLPQELQMIELEYLRCLMLSKNPIKAKIALQWNLLYQPQELQSQILMNLSSKFMQELSQKVEPLFIDNRFITIKQFVEKYFSQLIAIIDNIASQLKEKEEKVQKEQQRKLSALIIDDFKILLKKCKKMQQNKVQTQLGLQNYQLYWNKFNQILYTHHLNGSLQLRLIADHLPTFIELSNEFSPLQPKLAEIMLDAFQINSIFLQKVFDLNSNLGGKGSKNQICRNYPQINMIYFHGSESSTSEGVEEVFNKVDTIKYSDKSFCQNCIYFDEIGLAETSIHNPLKVLHSKLQIHNEKKVAFIGISNVELDAAKMSRFLVLNRPPPEEQELKQTARLIYNQQAQKNYNTRYSNPMKKKSTLQVCLPQCSLLNSRSKLNYQGSPLPFQLLLRQRNRTNFPRIKSPIRRLPSHRNEAAHARPLKNSLPIKRKILL